MIFFKPPQWCAVVADAQVVETFVGRAVYGISINPLQGIVDGNGEIGL